MGTLTGIILALIGLGLLAFGVYQIKQSVWCAPDESHISCIRSWIGAIGPIIAAIALLIAIQQYSLARDTSERTLRAYIGIKDGAIQLVNLTGGGQGISVTMKMQNSGKTPAYSFTTWIRPPTIAASTEEPPGFGEVTPLDKRNGQSIVFADGEVNLNYVIPASPDQINEIRNGTKKIYISGGASFTDAFGTRRTFKFHDSNSAESNSGSGIWSLQPHGRGYQEE